MYQMIHFSRRHRMLDKVIFLKNTFLFDNVLPQKADRLINSIQIEEKVYHKGETIFSPEEYEKKVGFVYHGECIVGRESVGGVIPLNVAKQFDSFGIITCFSDRDEFPTMVIAKTNCSVLFIHVDALSRLIEEDHIISLNIINFLTKKISFLNDKIATFSGGTIEEKLANYILALRKKYGSLEFEFNKKKSAEALNCGRASLYRAIDSLKNSGYIELVDKKIIINDPQGLERIVK